MSGNFNSVTMFVSLIAISLAASRAGHQPSSNDFAMATASARAPASLEAQTFKESVLAGSPIKRPLHKHTEKIRGPLSVKLELTSASPSQVGDIFVLKGVVTADASIQNIRFKWAIPAGVEIVSGAPNGTIAQLDANSPKMLEVTLKKVSDQNEQIHLQAEASISQTKFGDVAQFNTDLQEALEPSSSGTLKAAGKVQGREEESTPTHSHRVFQ